jgi:hypothetical protein
MHPLLGALAPTRRPFQRRTQMRKSAVFVLCVLAFGCEKTQADTAVPGETPVAEDSTRAGQKGEAPEVDEPSEAGDGGDDWASDAMSAADDEDDESSQDEATEEESDVDEEWSSDEDYEE